MKTTLFVLMGLIVSVVSCTEKKEDPAITATKMEEKVSVWRSPGGVDFQVRSTSAFVDRDGTINLYAVGAIISTIADWPDGKVKFRAKLRGSKALGEWPCAEFYVDAERVGKTCTANNGEAVFEGAFKKSKDQRVLSVRFINDAFNPKTREDRNLTLVDFMRM